MDPVSAPPLPRRHSWLSSRAEACAPLPPCYRRRDVENAPLHRAVRHHRAAFAAVVARRGQMMPKLVERELDGYVGCGVKVIRFGGQFSDAVGCLAASYISSCCTGVLYPIVE